MKKIGLVTPFRVPNYGTKLQAYAISNYFSSVVDGNVEIINYNSSSDKRLSSLLRKIFSVKLNIARIKKLINKRKVENCVSPLLLKKRISSINSFDKMFVLSKPVSTFDALQSISKNYDCLICGSDQIWIPDNLKGKYYTLEFCNSTNVKKGSYAASLGVEKISPKQRIAYSNFLKKLDFISVRENIGVDLLSNVCPEKSISWVCDPTFLLSKEKWLELEKEPDFIEPLNSKYIFCYFLGVDPASRQKVYDYAKNNNLKIFTIANFKGFCKEDTALSDVQMYDLSVNEFLYMINHAELICTDSMHATIFSIIFEKNFVTFERFNKKDGNSRNSRIYSLLQVMNLQNRLVEFSVPIPQNDINYEIVRPYKKEYIEKSKEFIQKEILSCL